MTVNSWHAAAAAATWITCWHSTAKFLSCRAEVVKGRNTRHGMERSIKCLLNSEVTLNQRQRTCLHGIPSTTSSDRIFSKYPQVCGSVTQRTRSYLPKTRHSTNMRSNRRTPCRRCPWNLYCCFSESVDPFFICVALAKRHKIMHVLQCTRR